uniref:Inositol 1,4,5-trisphosphate receptor type 3 n=1 Tax=Magallana gigas TaxID=29159 RepID=K1PP64_MAGGI
MEEFHEKYGGAVGAHDIRSDARKEYESYYEMEEEINRQLNVFSVNMRVAYGGPNTVEAQTDYNSNAVYSEVGGDEELPLGPEFQDHLRCFVDTSKKDPVDRYRMSEKLIRQLEISHKLTHLSEKEKLEQVELDVKCLKLLRALIYNEAVKLPADWETETYTHRKRLLHAMYQSKVEEAVQQAKALQKAMASGKMAQTEILKANRLGSMLSMAKTSMTNLRPASNMLSPRPASRFGAKSKLGGPMSRENTLLFTRGNTMMENNFLQPPALAVNGIKKSTTHLNGSLNGFSNQKTKVAPMDDAPQIQIEKVDEEELKELLGAAMTMTGDFTFKDDGYIELVLRMLGLMCDNQHSDIQNYIRDQFDNIKSVNLVAETTKFLNILYSNINEQTMPLVVQLFDTLVEFTSGNQKNQSVVFENKVCDYINHVLRIGQYGNCGINEVTRIDLKKKWI